MQAPLRLLSDRRDDLAARVAERCDAEPAREVEVLAPFGVDDPTPGGGRPADGRESQTTASVRTTRARLAEPPATAVTREHNRTNVSPRLSYQRR